jgi:polyketide biosynthesis acyl carrier protein
MTAVRPAVLAVITEILPDVPPEQITDDRSLADLGADSVERVEIITTLVERLNRDDPLARFAAIADIGALVAYLAGEEGR